MLLISSAWNFKIQDCTFQLESLTGFSVPRTDDTLNVVVSIDKVPLSSIVGRRLCRLFLSEQTHPFNQY